MKNWCLWTVALEKTLKSLLDSKEIKPINPKGNQLWIFIGRTDAEAEAPILWPLYANSRLIRKDPDTGKDWRQEEKVTTENWDGWVVSLARWTWVWVNSGSWLWTGGLVCCSPWGCKEVDMTEQLTTTMISFTKCGSLLLLSMPWLS